MIYLLDTNHAYRLLERDGFPNASIADPVAATARVSGLTVLSADRHFSFISGLRVEHWLA